MIALALRYWWAVVIAALLALLGVQSMRLNNAQTAYADHLAEDALARAAESEEARWKEQADQTRFDEEAQRAREENQKLLAAYAALADAGDRVRDELAEFKRRARAAPSGAPVGGSGKPGADALDLLADLYARADSEAGILAGYADALRAAGATCERASDAVTR